MTDKPCCGQEETVELTEEELLEQQEFEFLVNKETNAAKRLEICKECPSLKALNRCSECGCFMDIKTRLFFTKCPLGKW